MHNMDDRGPHVLKLNVRTNVAKGNADERARRTIEDDKESLIKDHL